MPFPRWFFWSVIGLTLAIYGAMALWGTPRLIAEAGGLLPFDLRPFGYSAEEARAYLAALSPEGKAFYLDVIGRLDAVFPPLLALSLIMIFIRLAGRRAAAGLSVMALAGAVLDLLENASTSALMQADPSEVTDAAIAAASRWTMLKWSADAVCLVALIVLLSTTLIRRIRTKA